MSSFAAANLVGKEHKLWVVENMEPGSFLLELNKKWLCYLTEHDQDLFNYMLYGGSTARIPKSVEAISQKAPVFYLNHPEDHGWGYCAIDKGTIAGRFSLDYEGSVITEENGLAALSLFGFSQEEIAGLRAKINLDTEDFEELFDMAAILTDVLCCDIDFVSHEYLQDNEESYPIISRA